MPETRLQSAVRRMLGYWYRRQIMPEGELLAEFHQAMKEVEQALEQDYASHTISDQPPQPDI